MKKSVSLYSLYISSFFCDFINAITFLLIAESQLNGKVSCSKKTCLCFFCRKNDEKANYDTKSWLERVVIVGLDHVPKYATLDMSGLSESVTLEVMKQGESIIIRKPGVVLSQEWSIQLHY